MNQTNRLGTHLTRCISMLLMACSYLVSDCSSEPAPAPIDVTCAGQLKAKNLVALKHCFEGSWKIVYTKNLSGQKQLLTNSLVRMTSDSLFYFSEGDIIAESSFALSSNPDPSITFTNWREENFNWKIESITDDTVFLSDATKRLAIVRSDLDPAINCEGYLRQKALNQIKGCILGRWQFCYYAGGYSGHDKYYYTSEYILDFRPGDSLDYILDGKFLRRAKLEWRKTASNVYGEISYIFGVIDPSGAPTFWRGVDGLENDTLSLYDDAGDGYGYALIRK